MPSQLKFPLDYATMGGWSNTWEILSLDGILALAVPDIPAFDFSGQFDVFTFNFSIPATARIDGAIVTLYDVRDYNALSADNETFRAYLGDFSREKVVSAYYDDGSGNNVAFGGAFDTWGWGSGLTPAIVNSPGFFVSWFMEATSGKTRSLGVDALSLEIFYSEPEGVRPWPRVFSGPRLLR